MQVSTLVDIGYLPVLYALHDFVNDPLDVVAGVVEQTNMWTKLCPMMATDFSSANSERRVVGIIVPYANTYTVLELKLINDDYCDVTP